jgi:hypothetical protein
MPIINGKEVTLADYSVQFRTEELARNKYGKNNLYTETSPDALSDGDELGKGEKNGSIGSRTDIVKRTELESKNFYTPNNPYDSSKV